MTELFTQVRPPAVAGLFYPGARAALASNVEALLAAADDRRAGLVPKAIIAPHAGYIYSGPIAASVYAALKPARARITRVVLLGPTHRVAVRGLALPDASAFATPLGTIAIDAEAIATIGHLPQVSVSGPAHALEHSLEVHLPFLQQVLAQFRLVPLAVGQTSAEEVAQVLDLLWGGSETLIVVSSDLSHYLGYEAAQALDRGTCESILGLSTSINHQQACGATPVTGLNLVARQRGLKPVLLDARNSGDTAGDRKRVVGYASFAFYENSGASAQLDSTELPANAGAVLLPLARAAIAEKVGITLSAPAAVPWLRGSGASFVTLTREGRLRGCIGSLRASRPLLDDVRHNAVAAAFHDPRFKPLTREEYETIAVEVSVLSPLEPMYCADENDALEQLRSGIDGLVFEYGHHRSTFLPQVWESLPQPAEFFGQLKRKAGLPPDFWDAEVKLARYTVSKWREGGA